jgi:hypothetical protein
MPALHVEVRHRGGLEAAPLRGTPVGSADALGAGCRGWCVAVSRATAPSTALAGRASSDDGGQGVVWHAESCTLSARDGMPSAGASPQHASVFVLCLCCAVQRCQ